MSTYRYVFEFGTDKPYAKVTFETESIDLLEEKLPQLICAFTSELRTSQRIDLMKAISCTLLTNIEEHVKNMDNETKQKCYRVKEIISNLHIHAGLLPMINKKKPNPVVSTPSFHIEVHREEQDNG